MLLLQHGPDKHKIVKNGGTTGGSWDGTFSSTKSWGSGRLHALADRSCEKPPGRKKNIVNLPETNIFAPPKMDGWNTSFLLGRPIFRGYICFREGRSQVCLVVSTNLKKSNSKNLNLDHFNLSPSRGENKK